VGSAAVLDRMITFACLSAPSGLGFRSGVRGTLQSEELPMSLNIACIRRIPRASLISLTLALQPVLARLKENPTDRAAKNILWLFPRLVLRRDPPKTAKSQGRLSQRRREMLLRHADAAPAGDCLSQRISRFTSGDWEELHEDYIAVARLGLAGALELIRARRDAGGARNGGATVMDAMLIAAQERHQQ
jgi:hypothetical protein